MKTKPENAAARSDSRGHPLPETPESSSSFRMLCQGSWRREQMRVSFENDMYRLPTPHAARSLAFWEECSARADSHFYNGELFRLEGLTAHAETLHLHLSRTCYRDQLYNNAHLAELGEAAATRGLGVSAIVITSDGYTPIIRRSAHVGEAPGMLDVIGGHAHPNLHLREGIPDLFAAIAEEVAAELGLPPNELTVECCNGIVENPVTLKPDIIFLTRVAPAMAQLEKLAQHASEADEFTEMLALHTSAPAVMEFCKTEQTNLTAPALGCLAILAGMQL